MILIKKFLAVTVIVFLISMTIAACGGKASGTTAPAAETQKTTAASVYSKYLAVSDLEEATGLSGLKCEEQASTLKFTDSKGNLVYEVKFYGKDFYEEEVGGNKDYYKDVPGIGDKAALALPDMPYRLVFTKGDRSVLTQVLTKDSGGNYLLNEEQLISVAKSIAEKL